MTSICACAMPNPALDVLSSQAEQQDSGSESEGSETTTLGEESSSTDATSDTDSSWTSRDPLTVTQATPVSEECAGDRAYTPLPGRVRARPAWTRSP